ncbi:unnamed protein product, partial [Discosporangium mesarthrocarpum]
MEDATPPVEKKGRSPFSASCVSVCFFLFYVGYVCYNLHGVMHPLRGITTSPDESVVSPLWKEGTEMKATFFLAASKDFYVEYFNRSHPLALRAPIVARAEDLTLDMGLRPHVFNLNVSTASMLRVGETET